MFHIPLASCVCSSMTEATDVAAEMAVIKDEMADCQTCTKGCTAAVAMLGVSVL